MDTPKSTQPQGRPAGSSSAAGAQEDSVVEISWPSDAERRSEAESRGQGRLLLVEPGVAAPVCNDPFEDWIRIEDSASDRQARLQALMEMVQNRASQSEHLLERIVVDDNDLVHAHDHWAALPPIEAELVRALLFRHGAVVSREVLLRAGWPDGAPTRNDLDVHISRLRRRLAEVGLAIRTVRSRGYVLDLDPDLINTSEG